MCGCLLTMDVAEFYAVWLVFRVKRDKTNQHSMHSFKTTHTMNHIWWTNCVHSQYCSPYYNELVNEPLLGVCIYQYSVCSTGSDEWYLEMCAENNVCKIIGYTKYLFIECMWFFFLGSASAIRCYQCSIETCPSFNQSTSKESFEIDCPHSTMCLKRIYPYELTNGELVETFERGCANQLDSNKVLSNHIQPIHTRLNCH